MRSYLSLIVIICLAVFSLTSPAAPADKMFEQFLEEKWQDDLKTYPEFSTSLGLRLYNDKLTDYSLEAIQSRKDKAKESLAALKKIKRTQLNEKNQLNYDLYIYQLEDFIAGSAFPQELFAMDQMSSWITQLPEVLKKMPRKNKEDFENIIARMEKIPTRLDEIEILLELGLEKGITPPQVTLKPIKEQFEVVLKKGEKNPFLGAFSEKPADFNEAEFERYKSKASTILAEQLLPRFEKFQTFFNKKYLPKARQTLGFSELPNGKAWYEFQAKHYTTTDLTPDEIHKLGLKEVERISGEMQKVLKKLNFEGDLNAFNEFLRTSPLFYFEKPEDLMQGYRDIAKRADAELVKLFGLLPRTPYGVIPTPDYMAPGAPTAYYMSGNLKAGRPGYFYANTYNLKSRPKYEMEALTLHEAVPGHHLQISLAQEMEDQPNFRKHYSVTAFIEGWGLYAESLGEEMGFYKDPYSKYGQLTYEIWRAIRLVVDTGIHTKGWSRDKAIEYFLAHSGKTRPDVEVEVDRYIVWPGQALAYKMGELKMKELKALAKKELGEKFDIREFHDHLLGAGALPLDLLEKRMKEWMKEAGALKRASLDSGLEKGK